jgi:proteasome accessory factor B
MFERDKDELRSLGVPIEVGQMDAFFDDEPGYRIPPDQFALPDISLTADEAAVVGLATRVWQHARLAEATTEAVRKLTALGVDVDVSALDIVEPRLSADEPSFDVFWEATQERTPVVFDYVRAGETGSTTRHLQPWGVARYAGRWYVVGYDTDRGAERIFRLSRVQGEARKDGEPGTYEIPPGTDIGEVARRLAPDPTSATVRLLVRENAGHLLRRDADTVDTGVPGPDESSSWDRLVLTRGTDGLADELLGHGADVYVEEPADLRNLVVARLRTAVGDPA